jgi:hypothetical protein
MGSWGVPQRSQFDAATALLIYILGLAGQSGAGALLLGPAPTDQPFSLGLPTSGTISSGSLYPFVRQMAGNCATATIAISSSPGWSPSLRGERLHRQVPGHAATLGRLAGDD